MRFTICYANHGTGVSIEDSMLYLRNALRVAGHEAYIAPFPEPGTYNIMHELFAPETPQSMAQSRRAGHARFIIVATEFTNGTTFNAHSANTSGHYGRTQYWQKRFDTFCEAAKSADAVWCMMGDQLESYRELLPDVPVFTIPRCFDPLTVPPRHASPGAKDIDLLFTGSPTDHRDALLGILSRSFKIVASTPGIPLSARLDLMARSKVNLHINLVQDALYSSIMRHHFVINNQGAMVSERAIFPGDLDEFITVLETDTLVDEVADFVRSGRWQTAGEEAYERYRAARPMKDAIAELLAVSLSAEGRAFAERGAGVPELAFP